VGVGKLAGGSGPVRRPRRYQVEPGNRTSEWGMTVVGDAGEPAEAVHRDIEAWLLRPATSALEAELGGRRRGTRVGPPASETSAWVGWVGVKISEPVPWQSSIIAHGYALVT
jgi:hypothetical protein